MANLNPNKRESFDAVQRVIDRIKPEWEKQPNILDIVPALKTRGGKVQTETLVIGFHVSEKVGAGMLEDRGFSPIPKEIDGIPTDVILARRKALGSVDTKDTRSQMFDTLIGGIAVGNANMNVYGTLAVPVLAQSDGRMVGLTNEHVLVFDGDGHVGDEVQQPRFYLNSEVSLDNAACCPNGTLHYRGVDNPIVDGAAAVFAAAALAAALSDKIDPHRRGQDATKPAAKEKTLLETVAVDMNYPEIPLPGQPYKLDVKWKYQRDTDKKQYNFDVAETMQNLHAVAVQELLTNKYTYVRGETVTFLALLSPEKEQKSCGNFFVTAAALSPSRRTAYKIILRSFPFRELGAFRDAGVTEDSLTRCSRYTERKPGEEFTMPRVIGADVYDPRGRMAVFVQTDAQGTLALRFPGEGLVIRFRTPVDKVTAKVRGKPVKMTAFKEEKLVGTSEDSEFVEVSAHEITQVVLTSRSEAPLLFQLCETFDFRDVCLYRGQLQLSPAEELGNWNTYLYAQTRNDVALGAVPTVAAQTIGGLPVTSNFVSTGESDSFIYGHRCNVEQAPYGSFEVVDGGEHIG